MRASNISTFFLFILSLSLLTLTACDNPNEKEEVVAPVQGALLTNGKVPPISPEGAAALKAMIGDLFFVKQYNSFMEEIVADMSEEKQEEFKKSVEFKGKFDVFPRKDHYEVVFPSRISIMPKEEGVDKVEIFHDVKLRVRPTGDPAAFYVTYDMSEKPFYVNVTAGDQTSEVMSISYKTVQPYTSLWHNDIQNFIQFEGGTQNFNLVVTIPPQFRPQFDGIDGFSVEIANVLNNVKMQPDDNNLWSGPFDMQMDNTTIKLPQGIGDIRILGINLKQNIKGLNPNVYKSFYKSYDEFMQKMSDKDNIDKNNVKSELLPFLKAYKSLLTEGFESFDAVFGAFEIMANLNNTPKDPQALKTFRLKEIEFRSDGSGFKGDKNSLNLAYTLKGMDLDLGQFKEEFGGDMPEELIPENISFSAGLEDFPVVGVFDMAINLVQKAEEQKSDPEAALMAAQDGFINLLVEKNTKFKLNDTYLGNSIWLLLANGTATMNKDAIYKVQAEKEIRFYGMDYLMQTLDTRMKSPDTSPVAQTAIQQAAMGLGMFQMFGQQKKDDQGRDYRSYVITLDPSGQVQMNGTDISQMMGGM